MVQVRLHCALLPGAAVLVAGATGTHVLRQFIASESQPSVQVVLGDTDGSNCTGGGGGTF